MDAAYLESVVNRDGGHVVLGCRLHPFCLYDALILAIDENPIFGSQGEPDWGHLVLAVLICSSEPTKFLSPTSGMIDFVRTRVWIEWKKLMYRRHFVRELAKFLEYIQDYHAKPEFWFEDSPDGKSLKAPWILSLATFIEAHSNMTEDEVMKAPIGKMLWKSAALGELLGQSNGDLMSEIDRTALKELGLA